MASIHQTVAELHDAGLIDKATMKTFDTTRLPLMVALKPEEIRSLREREGVSQAMFARHLNVSINVVSQWKRGEKKPQGPSLKLLSLINKKGLAAIAYLSVECHWTLR